MTSVSNNSAKVANNKHEMACTNLSTSTYWCCVHFKCVLTGNLEGKRKLELAECFICYNLLLQIFSNTEPVNDSPQGNTKGMIQNSVALRQHLFVYFPIFVYFLAQIKLNFSVHFSVVDVADLVSSSQTSLWQPLKKPAAY